LDGALVSTDAMGCQTTIAQSPLDAGADYLLAVKDNQPTLHAEIESYFATAPAAEVEKVETIDKDHGRFEVRNYSVSHQVDWYAADAPIRAPRHLLPRSQGSGLRGGGARSLGDRKQAALGSRRDIRRGPVTPTHRSRSL